MGAVNITRICPVWGVTNRSGCAGRASIGAVRLDGARPRRRDRRTADIRTTLRYAHTTLDDMRAARNVMHSSGAPRESVIQTENVNQTRQKRRQAFQLGKTTFCL